jgi:predicted short-subunit dehydrogenase-like oxidoreductase (DUF2520 family)
MRQVPHYLLIGDGRTARHFSYYFSQLSIPFSSWNRHAPQKELAEKIIPATHILLLINDDAIENFIEQNLQHATATLIHCSGRLNTQMAISVHPLTSFAHELYTLEQYQNIPFIVEKDNISFEGLFPQLPNPHFYLDKNQKAKYHALCVASGNFSCILWQKLFKTFEEEFGLPAKAAHAYLQQQTNNLINDYQHALTGPLVRDDAKTIENNIAALDNDPLQKIYQLFVQYYQLTK